VGGKSEGRKERKRRRRESKSPLAYPQSATVRWIAPEQTREKVGEKEKFRFSSTPRVYRFGEQEKKRKKGKREKKRQEHSRPYPSSIYTSSGTDVRGEGKKKEEGKRMAYEKRLFLSVHYLPIARFARMSKKKERKKKGKKRGGKKADREDAWSPILQLVLLSYLFHAPNKRTEEKGRKEKKKKRERGREDNGVAEQRASFPL